MTDRAAEGLARRRRRLDRMLLIVPYAALAGATALARPDLIGWALVVATAAWLARRHRGPDFFAGLVLLSGALVWRDPLFGFFAWTAYLFTVQALRGRWRLAGAAAVGLVTAAAQIGGFDAPAAALVVALNVAVACAMTMIVTVTHDQQVRHAEMVDRLEELQERLLVQAREAGVRDERQRMAGEIHDVLAQGLTGIVTQLEAAETAADWRHHVDAAKRLARDGLVEARRSVRALRPGSLDAATLPDALADLVAEWARLHPARAELIVTGDERRLLPEIEVALLRAAQEALANAGRHARAGRVALTLSYLEDVVTLDVRDDGVGFGVAGAAFADVVIGSAAGGFGLAAMRERVIRVGGTLVVESEPGDGTAISVCVPALGRTP